METERDLVPADRDRSETVRYDELSKSVKNILDSRQDVFNYFKSRNENWTGVGQQNLVKLEDFD